MALTTPTAIACRTAAPADEVAEEPVAEPAVELVVEAYPRAAVASTRSGEHASVACAEPCTPAWFILASRIW